MRFTSGRDILGAGWALRSLWGPQHLSRSPLPRFPGLNAPHQLWRAPLIWGQRSMKGWPQPRDTGSQLWVLCLQGAWGEVKETDVLDPAGSAPKPQPCTSFLCSAFSDITLVAWNWPQWDYSHHGNWLTLQIIASLFFSLSSENLLLNLYLQGTSLAIQWLRLHASTAGGTGLIHDRGTKTLHARQQKKFFTFTP